MSNPGGGDFPVGKVADPSDPLRNLSAIRTRMDSLHRFLSETVRTNTLIGKDQMAMVSSEISSAIHQIILNGAALLAASIPAPSPTPFAVAAEEQREGEEEEEEDDVVEIDAVELLAEHVHICDVCGKGFKRDANLRMHMRAHGDRFKTPQALAKPGGGEVVVSRRFSCPYEGCNRNRRHGKFRALKSVVCLRNHFKRSHCPKMYACERCNGKSFAVAADLRSHLRHCGRGEAARWRCSCGTTFTRKDKLFGHVALFEGHMPAPAAEEEEEIRRGKEKEEEDGEDDSMDGFFDGLLDELGPVGGDRLGTLQDVLGCPNGGFQVGFYGGCL